MVKDQGHKLTQDKNTYSAIFVIYQPAQSRLVDSPDKGNNLILIGRRLKVRVMGDNF